MAIMGIRMKVPHKIKNKTTIWSNNLITDCESKENQINLFIIAKIWNQPNWLIRKWVFIHYEILFSNKKEQILTFVTSWINLKGSILREVTQTQKIYLISHSHEDSKAGVGSKQADTVKWTRDLWGQFQQSNSNTGEEPPWFWQHHHII